jgi:arylformamidase
VADWIDITAPLQPGMPHWPGDPPFERSLALAIAKGDLLNLSQITTTVHIGTHIDAPSHFFEGSATIDQMPLDATVGPARVIGVRDPELIRISEIEPYHLRPGERVLFRTANSRLAWKASEFVENFVHIPPDTAAYLASRKVRTVGVDYLSVGGFFSGGAETHQILLSAGIWIIEGLQLQDVEPGDYELICLPLKIVGSDGAPARAIIRRI